MKKLIQSKLGVTDTSTTDDKANVNNLSDFEITSSIKNGWVIRVGQGFLLTSKILFK